MAMYYLIFLAIVQGITEFLPISSSAHLILGRDLMSAIGLPPSQGTAADELAFDIALHVGSLGAVLLYFRRDVGEMMSGLIDLLRGHGSERSRLLLLVAAGTVPILIVGFLARNIVSDLLRASGDHGVGDDHIRYCAMGGGSDAYCQARTQSGHIPRWPSFSGLMQGRAINPGDQPIRHHDDSRWRFPWVRRKRPHFRPLALASGHADRCPATRHLAADETDIKATQRNGRRMP